jgi:hydrogenase expression/formation protein HypC
MCVAVPSRIVDIQEGTGTVDVEGARRSVSLLLLPEARVGDFVIVHAGFAIQRIDEQEACETLRVLREIAGMPEGG